MKKFIRYKSAGYFLLEWMGFSCVLIIVIMVLGNIEAQRIAERYPNDWRRNFLSGTGYLLPGFYVFTLYLIALAARILWEIRLKIKKTEDLSFHILLLLPLGYLLFHLVKVLIVPLIRPLFQWFTLTF